MKRFRKLAKMVGPLLLIELVVPGGTLVVLAILFKSGVASEALPAKLATLLPFLKVSRVR